MLVRLGKEACCTPATLPSYCILRHRNPCIYLAESFGNLIFRGESVRVGLSRHVEVNGSIPYYEEIVTSRAHNYLVVYLTPKGGVVRVQTSSKDATPTAVGKLSLSTYSATLSPTFI